MSLIRRAAQVLRMSVRPYSDGFDSEERIALMEQIDAMKRRRIPDSQFLDCVQDGCFRICKYFSARIGGYGSTQLDDCREGEPLLGALLRGTLGLTPFASGAGHPQPASCPAQGKAG